MPPFVSSHLGLDLTNQSNNVQTMTANSSDLFSAAIFITNASTFFSPTNLTSHHRTTTSITTNTTSPTTTTSASTDESTSWIYIVLGVLCWVAIFVGCGFACTQLCKAVYFTSDVCGSCTRCCKRNPGVGWLIKTKCFRFYFGDDCCFCRDNDSDDEPIGTRTMNNGQTQINSLHENHGVLGDDSIPSASTNAPPPPYDVALFMRRPRENLDNDEPTVTLSRCTEDQSLEQNQ